MAKRRKKRNSGPSAEPSKPKADKPGKRGGGIWLGGVLVALVGGAVAFQVLSGTKRGIPTELTKSAAKGFNVVVITLDTTRADRLGCYGYGDAKTPAIDQLADMSVRFDDAVAPVPLTLPSHTSVFTGLDPPNHGVRNNSEYRVDPGLTTLAEILKGAGYQTAAFVAAFVLDSRYGLDQGFDRYDDAVDTQVGDEHGALGERSASRVTNEALHWFGNRDADVPYFLWVHYFDPHYPYTPPMPYGAAFRNAPYDGEIAYMDEHLGRLIDGLKRDEGWERTVVVVVADHAESLWEHGESAHSRLIYDATQHVPLLLAAPGLFQTAHVVDDVVVTIQDVFPTVLDLVGIESPNRHDGVSLLDAVNHKDRVVYLETLAPYLESAWAPLFALRRHTDKYILAPEPEYYDLTEDPGELENLFASGNASTTAARDELVALMQARMADMPPLEEIAGQRIERDPKTLQQLESLGYISGGKSDESVGLIDPKYAIHVWEKTRNAKLKIAAQQFDEAWKLVNEALAASPLDRSALEHKGTLHAYEGDWVKAETAYRKALGVRKSSNGFTMVAAALIEQGKFVEAQETLVEAIRLEPEHGGAWVMRGDLLVRMGRLTEASASYERAASVDPYRYKDVSSARLDVIRRQGGGE